MEKIYYSADDLIGFGDSISDESIEGIDYICDDLKNHKETALNIISERTGLSKKTVRGKIVSYWQ